MSRRHDGGSTHTLEAAVILCIMFASIASVANFSVSRSSLDVMDAIYAQKVRDQLMLLADSPLGDGSTCDGETKLDRMIFDGLEGDHDEWNKSVVQRLGPAYDVDMILDNRIGHLPIHGSGTVIGSAASYDWWPDLDYAAAVPSTNSASGTERQNVDVIAAHWGTLNRQRGEAVRMSATFESTTTTTLGTHVWAPTAMLTDSMDDFDRHFASNLTWVNDDLPELERELDGGSIALDGREPVDLTIRVQPGLLPAMTKGHIPSETTLSVIFPADWVNQGWATERADWSNETPAWNPHGEQILRGRATENIAGDLTLRLRAYAPVNPTRPFDIIKARLSGNGSLSESNLVVVYPASTERGLPRILTPTAPYPLRNNSWALFGAALANGGDDITVTSFDIEIPGGYDLEHNGGRGAPLFGEIDPDPAASFPTTGWTRTDARHIHWEGTVEVKARQAAQFYVSVHITPDVAHATAVEPAYSNGPNATLTYANGYEVTSGSWGKSPGVISIRVPPASRPEDDAQNGSADGYAWNATASALPETEVMATSRAIDVATHSILANLKNASKYRLSPASADAVAIENALGNATFEVSSRLVPVGSEVRVRGNIESLAEMIHGNGATGTLTIDLYSPPSLFCKPTRSWTYNTVELPHSAVTATLLWDGGTGVPGFFAATEDGLVHRIDISGYPIWSKPVAAGPTILKKLDLGGAGQYVVVGTKAGKVQTLRVTDGAIVGTGTLDLAKIFPITALEVDAASARIYAGDADGTVAFLQAPGLGAAVSSVDLGGPITDILQRGSAVYAHATTSFTRLTNELAGGVTIPTDGAGFAFGSDRIYLAGLADLKALDPTTLAVTGTTPFDAQARVSDRGDATGDGVEDLIVGLGGERVRVIDGTTGEQAYSDKVLDDSALPALLAVIDEGTVKPLGQPRAASLCDPSAIPATYGTVMACRASDSPGLISAVARDGSLLIHTVVNGLDQLRRYHSTGELAWRYDFWAEDPPQALDMAPALLNAHAVLVGDAGGTLTLHDDNANPVVDSTPSSRVGKFLFTTHVPEGGFFGTHVLVARLSWTVAMRPMEARLLEWFEVVDGDGAPVHRPAYQVVLTLAPHEGAGGAR